jgi:hypothetical protein
MLEWASSGGSSGGRHPEAYFLSDRTRLSSNYAFAAEDCAAQSLETVTVVGNFTGLEFGCPTESSTVQFQQLTPLYVP